LIFCLNIPLVVCYYFLHFDPNDPASYKSLSGMGHLGIYIVLKVRCTKFSLLF
jgi:hypothetical protein